MVSIPWLQLVGPDATRAPPPQVPVPSFQTASAPGPGDDDLLVAQARLDLLHQLVLGLHLLQHHALAGLLQLARQQQLVQDEVRLGGGKGE